MEFIWKIQLRLVTAENILCIRAFQLFFQLFDVRLARNAEQGESSVEIYLYYRFVWTFLLDRS